MRILTRPDFDGIVCAVLLSDALAITTPIKWVEPNAMQHDMVDVQPGDIIANLGFHERCELWFDHHESNMIDKPFKGVFEIAPSAAGLIYNYYPGAASSVEKDLPRFRRDYSKLIRETDKIDSANLSLDEILNPAKYPFLSLSMTILSHNYEDEPYWNMLVEALKNYEIEEILEIPEVKKRVAVAIDTNNSYIACLKKYTADYGNVTVSDFRPLGYTPVGNRFLVFYLFPGSVANFRVRFDNKDKNNTRISVGHSIFNKNCNVNAGLLCSRFGGGGHRGAGACTVPGERAEFYLSHMLDILKENRPEPFPILYEDEYFIAVDKPFGMLCGDSFCSVIEQFVRQKSRFTGSLQIVSPLNRETSGVVLLSKQEKGVSSFPYDRLEIKRVYFALVKGYFPHQTLPGFRFQVIQKNKKQSLLRVEPAPNVLEEDQIRAYLADIGFPIVGDKQFLSSGDPIHRLGLQATSLTFTHPITQKLTVLSAESHGFKNF